MAIKKKSVAAADQDKEIRDELLDKIMWGLSKLDSFPSIEYVFYFVLVLVAKEDRDIFNEFSRGAEEDIEYYLEFIKKSIKDLKWMRGEITRSQAGT